MDDFTEKEYEQFMDGLPEQCEEMNKAFENVIKDFKLERLDEIERENEQ